MYNSFAVNILSQQIFVYLQINELTYTFCSISFLKLLHVVLPSKRNCYRNIKIIPFNYI